MSRYKLSNILVEVNEKPEFETDREAWEYLRIIIPNRYATLYKEIELEVPNNNEEEYVPMWNAKYGPKPIGYGSEDTKLKEIGVPSICKIWIPVLKGITNHEYNINTK